MRKIDLIEHIDLPIKVLCEQENIAEQSFYKKLKKVSEGNVWPSNELQDIYIGIERIRYEREQKEDDVYKSKELIELMKRYWKIYNFWEKKKIEIK